MVIPTRVRGEETEVYLPANVDETWGFTKAQIERSTRPTTSMVENAVRRLLQLQRQPFAMRVGTTTSGDKLMVAITHDKPQKDKTATSTRTRLVPRSAYMAMWCTLSALAVTAPPTHWAAVAALTVRQFADRVPSHKQAVTEWEARDILGLSIGVGRPLAQRRDRLLGRAVSPKELFDAGNFGLEQLRDAITGYEGPAASSIREWAGSISPLDISEVPSELWNKQIKLSVEAIGDSLFAPRLPVYELPWLDRMPPQPPLPANCQHFDPRTSSDLLSEAAVGQIAQWLHNATIDLKCLEDHGVDCPRTHRPRTVVIGQQHFHDCAKGRVWECQPEQGCRLLDYTRPIRSNFDLDHLREKLNGYPDQRLSSNILEGIRLEADVELQIVLQPNSVTVGAGYDSVQATVRELKDMGFYDFHTSLPYVPIFVVSQGSRIKKGGAKYRRTSDFSGPHKSVADDEGQVVIPINQASRTYQLPSWMRNPQRPDLQQWDAARYAHVRWTDVEARSAHVRYKFPKEYKPRLEDLMNDVTILLGASLEINEPIIILVSDAAYYFNQFAYAPEELWKSTLVVGSRRGDVDTAGNAFEPHRPVFISEHRLGFGSFASSNLAQRFSNALVGWTYDKFDQLEERAYASSHSTEWTQWRTRRARLQSLCIKQRPKQPGVATPDCNQTRLASIHMYTDDPVMVVVGVDRALRLLQSWHEVTDGVHLVMAGPEKRQMGPGVEWIGVSILAAIGIVVVPRHKLIRARDALLATLECRMTFEDYRALVGLLEHLRFVAQLGPDATNALYRPHGKTGEGRNGPAAVIHPDDLMRDKLNNWISIIMTCAGALCTAALCTDDVAQLRASHKVLWASSDAAGDGQGTPGIGGYIHGYYWRLPLPALLLSLLHITAWELLGAAVTVLVAARIAGEDVTLIMRSDASLVAPALTKGSSKSKHVQTILHLLTQMRRYRDAAGQMTQEHISGDGNLFADLVSRGLWDEFWSLCAALKIRAIPLPLQDDEIQLLTKIVDAVSPDEGTRYAARLELRQAAALAPPPPYPNSHHARPLRVNPSSSSVHLRNRGQSASGPPDDFPGRNERNRPPATTDPYDPPNRKLGPVEQGLGKRRRDNSAGDGPAPWEVVTSSTRTLATSVRTAPPWTPSSDRTSDAATPCPPRRPTRRGKVSPYHGGTTNADTYCRPIRPQPEAATQSEIDRLVTRLVNDRTAARFDLPEEQLRDMVTAVARAKTDGTNPRSNSKEQLAWQEFATFAALHGFDPNLRTSWTRAFPERESLKLAGFLLFTSQRMQPRSSHDPCAKPQSVYQRYLALRRVFVNGREQELPPSTGVRAAFKGLLRRFLAHHGIANLRPKRVEPITPDIVGMMVRLAQSGHKRIKGTRWTLTSRECFSITAWAVVNLQVGSRKGESVRLPGDTSKNDWYTRDSVTFRIGGRVYIDPPGHVLQSMNETDVVYLAPKGAKCDQWGTCWGTDPIVLPYHVDTLNPARWLRDLELAWPCHGQQRQEVALFSRCNGEPFSDSRFSALIHAVLIEVLGPERARLYTPHSWRVWLASALRMLGAPDALIQAFGRWMNPQSLKIYARMTSNEYVGWMDKVMSVKSIDATRVTNLPIMDTVDLVSGWHSHHALNLFDSDIRDTLPMGHDTPSTSAPARKRRRTNKTTPTHIPLGFDSHRGYHPTPVDAPQTRRRPRPPSQPRRCPPIDVGRLTSSTTGVGRLTHVFPDSLDGYQTYYERLSTRPMPRERVKS